MMGQFLWGNCHSTFIQVLLPFFLAIDKKSHNVAANDDGLGGDDLALTSGLSSQLLLVAFKGATYSIDQPVNMTAC